MSETTFPSDTAALDLPPALRFFNSFLQERNIKWLLAVGTLILLGSSLMLVASHWGEYTPLWKYLIMLGYTGVIHAAGQWSYHQLGLRKTGSGLMVLTVLLLPALFLGLAWVQGHAEQSNQVLHWAMLTLTLVFSALASQRIFRQFLRASQPTFLAGFLILCLALALAPALPAAAAAWAAPALWLVFCAGTIKVNRHVFWLTEQHQLPRIFGFFPIALLGGLFIAVFTLNFSRHIALEWLGLACVLTAIPILLATDALARVYKQRSGGLILRQPAAIMLPLLVALLLSIGGIALATAGVFAAQSGLAVTPTAALAALIFGWVALRTGRQTFVWIMLVCITLAYNFAPFFFRELALQLIDIGAAAVNEQKLPYAFYGLTYLPLIAAAMLGHVITRRRGLMLFSTPLQWFSIGVASLLLAVSLTHFKAMLPVAALMSVVFVAQTILYRHLWPALAAMLASLLTAGALADVWDFNALDLLTLTLLGQWFAAYGLRRRPHWPAGRIFARAGEIIALLGLLGLFGLIYLPLALLDIWQMFDFDDIAPLMIYRIALVAVLFDIARRRHSPGLSVVAFIGALTLIGAVWSRVMDLAYLHWLPLVWVLLSAIALYRVSRWQQRLPQQSDAAAGLYPIFGQPLYRFSSMILIGSALIALAVYTPTAWLAGAIATATLIITTRQRPQLRCLYLALLNWQLLTATVIAIAPASLLTLADLFSAEMLSLAPVLALGAVLSMLVWQRYESTAHDKAVRIARLQRWILSYAAVIALLLSWSLPQPDLLDMLCALSALLILAAQQLVRACREQQEYRVWIAEALIALAVAALVGHGFISFGHGWSPFIVTGLGVVLLIVARLAAQHPALSALVRPFYLTALTLPLIAVAIAVYRYFGSSDTGWLGRNSLAVLLAAGFYFWHGYEQQRRWALLLALAITNLALALLWRDLAWSDPQFYLIPIGASILWLRHLLREQLPARFHDPLNYLGALVILVSPMFHIATGSWLHIFTLMLASVAVILVAIGLRIRALMYTGAAFLLAAMIAMIVRGSIDNPNLLWLAGLLLGAAVFGLGAFAERNREQVLQRLRLLSASLADWD